MNKLKFLVLAAIGWLCSMSVSAEDFEVDGIYYNILSSTDMTVEVTYKGGYSSSEDEYSGSVIVPETVNYNGNTYSVTSIGDYAFKSCEGLTSVEIGNSVTSIGHSAFKSCYGLTSVEIGNSVTSIADDAFFDCSGLTSVVIPNSVTSIGISAFSRCSGLTSVNIPNSVTSIADDAFNGCSGLTSVNIPNSVTSIGFAAFWGCSGLTSVNIPNSVTSIGHHAFSFCDGLTSIVVEDGNSVYDSREGCNAIVESGTHTLISGCKNTIIPNSVTSIGYAAFYGCSGLTSVTIPNSVTSIGHYAFDWCSSLTSVNIPNSVTSIGHYAFSSCKGLTSVNIPNSVTSIGDRVFEFCSGLTSVVIPNSVTSIGERAFCYCSGLTSVNIPNSVTSIGDEAFCYCSGLTSVNIPNSVTSIGVCAFSECSGLTSVKMGSGVTSIGDYAFRDCSHLNSVTSLIPADQLFAIEDNIFLEVDRQYVTLYVPAGAKATYQATDGWKEFTNIVEFNGQCGKNLYWEFDFENKSLNFTGSGEMLIEGARFYSDCPWYAFANITEKINLSEGMTNISYAAFAYFKKIKEIEIPASVIKIEGNTDYYCGIFFGVDKVPYIYTPFTGCSSLKKITVASGNPVYCGENNAIIEKNTRRLVVGCNGTIMPYNISVIGACAFMQCDSITSIHIPYGVREIEVAAFNQMPMLESVTIPNSVRSIGYAAFIGAKCTEFNIPSSVKYIGYAAFESTGWYNNQPDGLLRIDDCIVEYKGDCPTSLNFDKDVRLIVPGLKYRGLQTLTINNENPYFYSPENSNVIIDRETNTLVIGSENSLIPNSATAIGSCAFNGYNITSIEIPSSVKSIEYGAFERCFDLENIILHDGLINIGDYAFSSCSEVTNITIPNSVTTIGKEAFSGCINLESITIGSGVTKISKKAFGYNRKLTTVTSHIPADKLFAIESNVFKNIDLTKVTLYVPAGAKATYQATDGWKNFANIEELAPSIYELKDGVAYTQQTDTLVNVVNYTRKLPNLYWNALYLPFELPYDVIEEGYEVAYINDVNGSDTDDDGDIDDLAMEIIKIKGGTLKANYPYLIKAKTEEDKAMSIMVEDAVLYAAEENSVDCSSVYQRYAVTGIYTKKTAAELSGKLAISTSGAWQPLAAGTALNPFRLYLSMENRDDSPVKVDQSAISRMRIVERGESTGMEEVVSAEPRETVIYDLSGRRVMHPVKGGVYIVNGKKRIF